MEKRIAIVKELVENGYQLVCYTEEEFASKYPLEVLETIRKGYYNHIGKTE
jgi:hypothetical protein